MHKALYRTPAKRRKEDFYYIVKIGRNEVSLVVVSEEATYFRIKETLQRMVNEGALEPVFQSNEGVHIRRVGRYPKDLSNKDVVLNAIKQRFSAISWSDLQQAKQSKEMANLERFYSSNLMIDETGPVISMKRGSFKDYVHDVLSEEFPELIKNLRKEYKMLSEEFEIA
jgi:hypothetical protein